MTPETLTTLAKCCYFASGMLAMLSAFLFERAWKLWRGQRRPSQLRGPDGRFMSRTTPMNRQLAEENRLYRVSKMEAANNK